jgi:hypothetical protein
VLPVDCDIIITDQPYGTGWLRGGGKVGQFKPRQEGAEWDVFNLAWMDAAPPRVATFCPAKGVWDVCRKLRTPHVLKYRKTNPAPFGYAEEPIVSSHAMPAEWEKEAYNGDNSLHPCQKPVDLLGRERAWDDVCATAGREEFGRTLPHDSLELQKRIEGAEGRRLAGHAGPRQSSFVEGRQIVAQIPHGEPDRIAV